MVVAGAGALTTAVAEAALASLPNSRHINRRRGTILLTLGCALVAACSGNLEPALTDAPPVSSAQAATCGTSASASLTQTVPKDRSLTYYGDILPILESARDNYVYKCTTCHADYLTAERVARVKEVELILASVESGSMPLKGDRMDPYFIEIFRRWRLTGLKIGDKNRRGQFRPPPKTDRSDNPGTPNSTSGCP